MSAALEQVQEFRASAVVLYQMVHDLGGALDIHRGFVMSNEGFEFSDVCVRVRIGSGMMTQPNIPSFESEKSMRNITSDKLTAAASMPACTGWDSRICQLRWEIVELSGR